jgi:hypothetical protein
MKVDIVVKLLGELDPGFAGESKKFDVAPPRRAASLPPPASAVARGEL